MLVSVNRIDVFSSLCSGFFSVTVLCYFSFLFPVASVVILLFCHCLNLLPYDPVGLGHMVSPPLSSMTFNFCRSGMLAGPMPHACFLPCSSWDKGANKVHVCLFEFRQCSIAAATVNGSRGYMFYSLSYLCAHLSHFDHMDF